ncbi:hypothetical protein BC828DRAFT_7334 [Blastocladiella britannica]|nr:hypothetical protein BC828DRAFT_7334 [Blastocladiella britannica]
MRCSRLTASTLSNWVALFPGTWNLGCSVWESSAEIDQRTPRRARTDRRPTVAELALITDSSDFASSSSVSSRLNSVACRSISSCRIARSRSSSARTCVKSTNVSAVETSVEVSLMVVAAIAPSNSAAASAAASKFAARARSRVSADLRSRISSAMAARSSLHTARKSSMSRSAVSARSSASDATMSSSRLRCLSSTISALMSTSDSVELAPPSPAPGGGAVPMIPDPPGCNPSDDSEPLSEPKDTSRAICTAVSVSPSCSADVNFKYCASCVRWSRIVACRCMISVCFWISVELSSSTRGGSIPGIAGATGVSVCCEMDPDVKINRVK